MTSLIWVFLLLAAIVWALLLQSRRFKRFLASHGIKRALLVIAHPDDEAMFFVPLLRRLTALKVEVAVLCLTNGNSRQREAELAESCRRLGVHKHFVSTFLKDGMKEVWDLQAGWKAVSGLIAAAGPDAMFTFDQGGVSGHLNHSSTHQLIVGNRESLGRKPILSLVTFPIWRKYAVPLHLLFLLTESLSGLVAVSFAPWENWRAMSAHQSQYVWFRRLFVAFSSYTYQNSFRIE